MAFWQSPEWMNRTDSIYALDPAQGDPDFLPWWREAWRLFRRAGGYDVVLTMGIRESFAYALLCRLAFRRSKQIMSEVFIDQPQTGRLAWRIKTAIYRNLARHAIGFITNSNAEIITNAERFRLSRERFRYVPLCTTIDDPHDHPAPDGYLFCAGRTLRDYVTLTDIMLATGERWHVVAGHGDLAGIELPERITVHREIDRSRYLQLLRGARMVVLPLLDTLRSTGQVVLLEAMAYGKPCITTRAPGTIDLVRNDHNGWLIEPGDARGAIALVHELLSNPGRCRRVGQQGLQDILHHYSVAEHTRLRLAAIRELSGAS